MIIVDGHNRQRLCEKHGLPYQMAVFSFEDLLEAKQWALDSGDLSINQGYNITRQVQELPEEQRDEAAAQAVELEKAKREIRQSDAESNRRHKIAGLFCKAFERAVLLTPSEENVCIWAECTRMTPEEIMDSAKEAHELAEVFSTIAGILETMVPGGDTNAR